MTQASIDTSQESSVHNVQDPNSNAHRIAHSGEREPLFSETRQSEDDHSEILGDPILRSVSVSPGLRVSKSGRQLRQTSSDQNYQPRSRKRESSVVTQQDSFLAFNQSKTGTSPLLDISVHRPSSSVWWPSSINPFHETNPRNWSLQKDCDVVLQFFTSEKRPIVRPSPTPWRIQRAAPTSGSFRSAHIRGFKWYPVRSASDPSILQTKPKPIYRGKDLPLKPCMKQKSKSAATSPPSGQIAAPNLPDVSKRRKTKSVDFEPVAKRILSLPLVGVWGEGAKVDGQQGVRRRVGLGNGSTRSRISLKRLASCPMPHPKSRPADSAITRTDVHVVAVAPPLNRAGLSTPTPPKAPTMQIVESKTGRYEVVWDVIGEEADIRAHRRASSASQSLQAITTTATKGLERVNSKLTEWSWREDHRAAPFTPQVAVYPDIDSHAGLDRAVANDEHLEIYAPPNSETSVGASRYQSHTTSRHTSRGASNRESEPDADEFCQEDDRTHRKHMVAYDAVYPSYTRAGYGSRGVSPLTDRRLSNMAASDLRFRGHRDSVALARSRIFDAGTVSSELDIRGSEITTIAEGITNIDSSVPAAEDAHYPGSPASEPLPTIRDDELSAPPTPGPKSAVQSLKASVSTPVLAPDASRNRHIRILG
jgi:hypothetical protein